MQWAYGTPSVLSWKEHQLLSWLARKNAFPLFERVRDELFDIRASSLVFHIAVVHISRDLNGLTGQLAKNAAARHWEPVYSGTSAYGGQSKSVDSETPCRTGWRYRAC